MLFSRNKVLARSNGMFESIPELVERALKCRPTSLWLIAKYTFLAMMEQRSKAYRTWYFENSVVYLQSQGDCTSQPFFRYSLKLYLILSSTMGISWANFIAWTQSMYFRHSSCFQIGPQLHGSGLKYRISDVFESHCSLVLTSQSPGCRHKPRVAVSENTFSFCRKWKKL